jgi:uncharacterized membrane protein YfhO
LLIPSGRGFFPALFLSLSRLAFIVALFLVLRQMHNRGQELYSLVAVSLILTIALGYFSVVYSGDEIPHASRKSPQDPLGTH